MAKSSKSSSFQSLGGGTYRVAGVVRRSAVTGRYVTASKAQAGSAKRANPQSAAKKTK